MELTVSSILIITRINILQQLDEYIAQKLQKLYGFYLFSHDSRQVAK